ncbi:hypothetical protein GGX14DRAFT_637988 [Mycena pura]|uniref:Uncharacterized protein n=1 Tax=Mycena pura TaxID=153505 RepID=A0AAD7E2K3_9AGAR|nr:hypothetical protein GGX14DRAFT_637988 [Mycena pura]
MSTLSHHDPPQRSWWALPQKSPNSSQVFTEKPHSHSKQSGKFNSFAAAMGLRQKKPQPPPLTIRDSRTPVSPPAVRLVPRTESHQRRPYTAPSTGIGRAPSNSMSSSRSRDDSLEPNTPRTPEDIAHGRHGSLLTLSDVDPFAARVVSVHSPREANRLSAFSHSSGHEAKIPEVVNRVSYASSSSQSFRLGSDLSPLSVVSPASEHGSASSVSPSDRKPGFSPRRKDASTTWVSNLGDTNRLSQPEPAPKSRPAMRARGMTDGGIERTNFIRRDSLTRTVPSPKSTSNSTRFPSSSSAPTRQISMSRPTAPPTAELPPPPHWGDDRPLGGLSAGSTSSSSLTFSPEFTPIIPRVKSKQSHETSPKAVESSWELPDVSPRPRTLKKSMSQQSLSKRMQQSPTSSGIPMPEPSFPAAPRKQRSFHRLPVPAVPLQLPAAEPLQPGRKRLFSSSSSRRPSQSTSPVADDVRSLYGTEPERISLTSASYWIDTDQPPQTPTSVAAAHEYTPQQIMSPAEMLQVEASVDASYHHPRPRGDSIVSASALSDVEHDFGFSPPSLHGVSRRQSDIDHRDPSVRSMPVSPAAAMYYPTLTPEPPSPPILMSLPPPPRRTKSRTSSVSSRAQSDTVSPLSPPPRRALRPKVSAEKRMHRQSLLRKPSFLDIDDEGDKDHSPPSVVTRQHSFLDLTRESFDSVRSDDSF